MNCSSNTRDVSRIRLERRRRGWTIIDLANAAGCSPSTVANAERGYVPDRLAERLGRVLGLSPAALKPARHEGPEAA